MAERHTTLSTDIAVFGAGIAGLWLLNRLKREGYEAVLFETDAIGGGQSIASQGIIHSGLKYALAGKISTAAQNLRDVPQRWRAALSGHGELDLSASTIAAPSQMLMVPGGLGGALMNFATKKTFGSGVREIKPQDWPKPLNDTGFSGSLIRMDELVLDIPSVIQALAEPHRDHILKIEDTETALAHIDARLCIFTAAGGNAAIAQTRGDGDGLSTQARPLLMGLMKNAPFTLFAHLVGAAEKPVATITTHHTQDGTLIWYIGGLAAEREKSAAPEDTYRAIRKALAKYMPVLDLSGIEWAVLPIDRFEGKSSGTAFMPDTPTIHEAPNALYCWPTKLTFAPLLADMVMDKLAERGVKPTGGTVDTNGWAQANYTQTPWDKAQWIKDS